MARLRPLVAPPGLVQMIHLRWDKSARGGQGSRDRNAVPSAFEIPARELVGSNEQLCINVSHWDGQNVFVEPRCDTQVSRSRS